MPEASSREFRPDLDREFQYLLGQMPRVDRETFQGLLIENAEISERVLEAENELFDAWVRGDLPRDWRPLFEERMLSTPEGRRKATVAQALAAASTQANPRQGLSAAGRNANNWFRRIAAMFCIAAVAGLWVWWTSNDSKVEDRREQQVARVETLRLHAVTRGDANRPKFRIAAATTHIRFGIPESEAAAAELSTISGKTVWKGSSADSLPASLLSPEVYLLTTFEKDGKPASYYEFEIAAR